MKPPTYWADHFLWLDLETTGLDPNTCRILEYAAALVHDGPGEDMSVEWACEGVIHQHGGEWLSEMDPFVTAMHTKNGLIKECQSGRGVDLHDAERHLLGLVGPAEPRSIVLAGSTIAFDQSFLRVHMPRFAALLSHRAFDVSTLKMAARNWCDQPFKKAEAHRAMADVRESLTHAAEIRRQWFAPR